MRYPLEHGSNKKLSVGKNEPIGATLYDDGVNFAVYSRNAKEVFLLLFDTPEGEPTDVIKIEHRTGDVWHTFVHRIKAGQLYDYKIKGEYNPSQGMRFNENKLLIDPYAKAISGKFRNIDNLLFAYDISSDKKDLTMDERDNTHIVPKSIVIDDVFDWQGDTHPNIPLEKMVIYEVHVKGLTAHNSSGVKHPGTYLGLIEKLPYLKDLGINALELLPIHEFYIQDYLFHKRLTNYWGYDTIGFFAPESSYSTQDYLGCQVHEFKTLVRELHKANIEVILDVVYNHTGEGNELGPTLCFKGVDNGSYYCLKGTPEEPYRYYENYTGCGNVVNIENPRVLRLVIDSLHYWVEVMHVDGFRFDLATVLGFQKCEFTKTASFFDIVSKDPVLSKAKLIAEPWDLKNYQVGNFPVGWSEWNGKFRDAVRKFVKGDSGQVKDLAWRLTGSSDLYGDDGRSPYNSINFITCHDGFTLNDLFSYDNKHNEANLEDNKDGTNNNNSWNCGFEGETNDLNIISLRKQMTKNALCCLLFSSGTPMILGGDEFMRTQKGNNNAYCQDNEITWFDWGYIEKNSDILEFCKRAIALRKRYTALERRKFFSGKDKDADNVPDIGWFGKNLDKPLWDDSELRTLCYQLDGSEAPSKLGNYHLFFILNADFNAHSIKTPQYEGMKCYRVVDTSLKTGEDFLNPGEEILLDSPDHYRVNPRSTVVLLGK